MMRSMKQIADSLGVDKQRVYRFIKKNNIAGVRQDSGMMMYDEAAESAIVQGVSGFDEADQNGSKADRSTSNEAVIAALLLQLEIKDKQIADLIADKEFLKQQAQAAQFLHAADKIPMLVEGQSEAPNKKPGLLDRIFKRRG